MSAGYARRSHPNATADAGSIPAVSTVVGRLPRRLLVRMSRWQAARHPGVDRFQSRYARGCPSARGTLAATTTAQMRLPSASGSTASRARSPVSGKSSGRASMATASSRSSTSAARCDREPRRWDSTKGGVSSAIYLSGLAWKSPAAIRSWPGASPHRSKVLSGSPRTSHERSRSAPAGFLLRRTSMVTRRTGSKAAVSGACPLTSGEDRGGPGVRP